MNKNIIVIFLLIISLNSYSQTVDTVTGVSSGETIQASKIDSIISYLNRVLEVEVPILTEFQNYNPDFNTLAVTNMNFEYRRVGDEIEIIGQATTNASTTTSNSAFFRLPEIVDSNTSSGFIEIDINKAVNKQLLGHCIRDVAEIQNQDFRIRVNSGNARGLYLTRANSGSSTGQELLNWSDILSNANGFSCRLSVPIKNWKATEKMINLLPPLS